jgi:hypothetical protein
MTIWVLVVMMNVAGVAAPVRAYVGVYDNLAACQKMVHNDSTHCLEEKVLKW